MRNSVNGTASQWYQRSMVRGAIAAAVVGIGLLSLAGHAARIRSERDPEQALQKALASVNRNREANDLPPLVVHAADATPVQTATADVTEPFRDAVNAAMAAAVAAQTADSPQAWAEVARGWQRAIANMQAVAPDHPRYETAQQKVVEYGRNFDYARRNAVGALPSQAVANPPESEDSPAPVSANDATAAEQGFSHGAKNGISLSSDSHWGLGIKILLTLGSAGLLIFILTLELDPPLDSEEKAAEKKSSRKGKTQPQHRLALEKVEQFLEERSWLNSPPVFADSAVASGHPAQRLHRKLYRELLSLAQDEQTAISLLKESMRLHPRQPVNWCCEQVIKDLRKNMPPAATHSFRRTV